MTDLERKKINQLTSIGNIQDGDVLVGERTNGTTVRITYAAPTGVSDGDKGDITVSSSGTVWTIDNDAITYAKIQNISATDKLLGRSSSGAGDIEEITCTSAGRAILDDLDAAAQRTTLGLGNLATQNGTFSGTSSGTNTGDQTSIVGITGTKAQFDTACTDGNFLYSGDVTQYTDEMAQDAVGAMVDSSLTYVDATPLLQRAALTGDVTASAGSNATTIATPSSATVATDDKVIIKDTSALDATKYVTAQSIRDLVPGSGTITSAQLAASLTDETGSGAAVFATSPTLVTPTLGVASATSINFGQDALNYYDEGTFTPTFSFATPGTLSVSYTTQTGQYTRIGNLIFIAITLQCTPTLGTASGQLRIEGLPFTSAVLNHAMALSNKSSNVTLPASATYLNGYTAGTTYCRARGGGSTISDTDLNPSNFTSGASTIIAFSGCYLI